MKQFHFYLYTNNQNDINLAAKKEHDIQVNPNNNKYC
jgi:hypothetical protein